MRTFLLVFIAVVPLLGQDTILPIVRYGFPERLRTYLALTEPQTAKISDQNSAFATWSQTRSERMWQVQSEIAEETAKDPLNPGALGVRYAEVEAIRREIADRSKKVMAENLAVLTPAQILKLKALEEALKLVPTGNEAKAVKLIEDDCASASYSTFLRGDFVPGGVITGVLGLPQPCAIPRITPNPFYFTGPDAATRQ